MKNKKIQYFASAAALILGAVLLTTCTVGLGDAVDTKSPKVSITYPPVQSIIKNTFTLRGTASDDNELVGVMITVTNTETDEVFDSYQATVDRATNTWSFVANRRNEDGSFEFEDGKYQIVATAVDGANRKTVASITYEIDNTPPVLVLNRPGTIGPLGSGNHEVYGSEIKLTGSANDDHALDQLTMRVFSPAGELIGEPLSYSNVSGVGMEILLAKHYENPVTDEERALTERYASIYNHNVGGTQEFYCLVDVSDYAREYDPPADVASEDNSRGNVSQAFWLYNTIYARVFDKSGFGMTMSDLTGVLSGRYANVVTAADVRDYLEQTKQDSSVWSENAVTFSLNPENSPYYEVMGYSALAQDSRITAQASNGSNLTVRVSAGRDRRPLKPETIRVYLDPCDENGVELSGDGDNILLLASVAELGTNTAAIEERNSRLAPTGDDYVVSVDIGTQLNGHYYLVKVEGEDQSGNSISDSRGRFGFQIIASGNPPVLLVTSPADLSYTNANSVVFTGTVEAEGGLSSLTARATITRISGGIRIRESESQTFTVVPSDSSPSWEFSLDTATGMTDPEVFMAEVFLEATDMQKNKTPQKIRLYIDRDPPKAEITRVDPYYSLIDGKYVVNGRITLTLAMTDNDQLVSRGYSIGNTVHQDEETVSTPVETRQLEINTTLEDDKDNLPISVTLRDRAGNVSIINFPADTINVDQDTDRPEVTITNLALSDQAGAADNWLSDTEIKGTLTDDDGIASVHIKIDDGTEVTDPAIEATLTASPGLGGFGKNRTFSLNLNSPPVPNAPLPDGIYRMTVTAKDTNLPAVDSIPVVTWFSYDNAKPVLLGNTIPADISRTRSYFALSGTASDTNALMATGAIRITQSYNGGSAHELPAVTITLDPDNTSCTWEALGLPRNPSSLTSSAATDGSHDGTYVYSVIATDRSGKSSTALAKTITFDTIAPVIGEITHPAESGANNLIAGSTTFRGEASDAGTGVTLVQYSLNSTDWFNANGFTIWNASFTFAPTEPEGPKTLYVRASDAAGNVSAIAERPFIYDTGAPELAAATVPAGLTLTNTGFSLSGSAEDGYKLRELNSVVITQQLGNGDKIPVPVSITPNGDNTSCTWTIGTLPRIPVAANIGTQVPFDGSRDGTYKYEITVYDAAGRSTISEITVQLDSSKPVITEVTKPAESGTGNFISEATDFSGKATDVGSGGVLVQYSLNNSDWHDANGFAIWNASFEFGPAEPEGEKTLYVRATDAAGNISDVFTRPFVYDKSAPSLTAANTVPADLTLTNTGFSLFGSAEDGYKLRELNSVVITQQLGNEAKIPVPVSITPNGDNTSCTWTIGTLPRIPVAANIGTQVPFDGSRDGTYKYEITVYDAAGQRSDSETITVQLDSRAPTAVINVPAANSVVGTNASFQGGASDPAPSSGIREIRYSLDGTNWTQIVPSATWNTTHLFDRADAEGEKTLRVVAEDTAGNVSPVVTRNFIFDRANPTLEIEGETERFRGIAFELEGNAKDSWGVDRVVVTQNGVDLPPIDASGSTDFNWELAGLPRNPTNTSATLLVDGVFTYTVQAIDRANKASTLATITVTIDTTPPNKNDITAPAAGALGVNALSGSTYLFRGEAGEPSEGVGVAKVWYQIIQNATAPAAGVDPAVADYTELATGGNWSFTKNFPAEIAEGTGYWLHVLAEDKAGNRNAEATSVEFDVDLSNPVVTEVIGTDTMQNRRKSFELGGTATDSHGIASVTITQSLDGGTPIEIKTNGPVLTEVIPEEETAYNWILKNLPRGNTEETIGNLSTVNDTYEYKITTTDLVGKTHTITRRVRFDSVGPEIEFTSPSYTPAEGSDPEEISWMNSGTLAVTGRATDLTAVAGVYYSTEAIAPPLPVQTNPEVQLTDGDWTTQDWVKAGGSLTNWSVPFGGLGQGVHAVWISAMDSNSNTTPAKQIKFGVDTALPTVTGTAPLANTNELFTIGGDISDTNKLDPDAPITITQSFNEGEPVTISGVSLEALSPDEGESYSWTLENVPRNPDDPDNPIALDGTADGVYDFLITAKDIAGKTREATISVRIDTRDPVLTVAEAVETSLSDWIKTGSLSLSGTVTDTDPSSGIRKVEYTHLDSDSVSTTQTLSVNGTNWTGNLPLSNGENQQLTITATDYAGNTDSTMYTFDVDTSSPTLTKLTPTGQLLTNLKSPIVSTFSVTDEGASGVASVLVTHIGSNSIDVGDQSSSLSGGIWTISVPTETLEKLTLGATEEVTVTATDGAGNSSISTFQISIDTEAPDVLTISTPENNATINKLTKIRGTASDEQSLSKVELYVETGPAAGTFPEIPTASFTGGSAYNWSYDFDTEARPWAAYTGPVVIRVIATDEAGNTRTLDYTYTIDQESDRPRIRSNNPELIFNHDATGYYPSTINTKNIIGTIEDDDGLVTSVEIKVVDHLGNGDWEPVTMSGTSFTHTVEQSDGQKTLYFRMTDAAGETFETGTELPPKFEWGPVSTPGFAYPPRVFSIDVTSPTKMPQVYVHRTGGTNFSESEELVPNMPFGGPSSEFVLWVGGTDANGIASIEIKVPDATPDIQLLESSSIDNTTDITDYTVFRSEPFNVSALASEDESLTVTVDIKITDTSGLTAFDSKVIVIDNKPPEINHTYPASETEQVFGNITISGLVDDGGSGLPATNAVLYKIGYDYASQPTWNTATRSGGSWTISDFTTSGTGGRIENYTRKEVTAVNTTTNRLTVEGHGYSEGARVWIGADEFPGGLAHSTPYYVRNPEADTFQLSTDPEGAIITITSAGYTSLGVSSRAESAEENIWYLPVMIRALDRAGNMYQTEEWTYRIKVDPSGDKPTIGVNYPVPELDPAALEPQIVGGTIRMSGWADDNESVSAVYMQIDANGDGLFNEADNGFVTVGGTPIDWYGGGSGRQVTGGRNWTQNINTEGEFNPEVEGTRRLLMYRVRAVDNNGTLGSWSKPHYFEIDEGVPQLDALAFQQGSRVRAYEPDMWLSGDWFFTGTIVDESDIDAVTVGNTPGASASFVQGDLNSGWFTSVIDGGLRGYSMKIPVNTFSAFPGGQTSHSFTLTATDRSDPPMTAIREIRIQYDNIPPDISAPYGGAIPIKNSNGWYELKSSVVEAQSGFDRVMVVLHRPDTIDLYGDRVYNPLYEPTDPRNYTSWGDLTESDEGLPLREFLGAGRPAETSLTLAGIGSDPYAREGYYIRIGGVYYRITDVTGDTITWEGEVDTDIVDFQLVYAIAVDLLNTEVSDMDGDGIIEAVTRSGGTYDWSCSINSTNLPDGQMNIRYVAFDKAGNFARHDDIATRVENNPPLLAQVRLGTDLDGNGFITDGSGATLNEWNPPYSTLAGGVEQRTATVDATNPLNSFTAKAFMEVVIDVVGGNGDLEYSLVVGTDTVHDIGDHKLRTGEYVEGSEATNTITVTLEDLYSIGDGVRNFVFNILDSTETYALALRDEFKAELTVALNVHVVDDVSPVVAISPFFWNESDDNSLYLNSRENGHIELADDLPAAFNGTTGLMDRDPKVSGMITVRGTAFDDQRLTKLWMYLGNGGNDDNAFVFTDAGDTETAFDQNPADPFSRVAVNGTYSLVAEFDPASGWEVADTTVEDDGWRFTVDSASAGAYFNQDGHMVAWTLEIDTAQLPRRAETDFHFRMIAEDKRTNAGGTSTPNASEIGEKRVDIVPYIRTIGSGLSKLKKNNPSVYNRTALGRYPVSEDETITVSGFNLGGDQSVSMASYSSGPFTHTVNGVTTLNNENRNTAEYNQLPNGDNNPHLTDDVILDVWQLNSTAVHSVDGRINEPVMKINPNNGIAGFAFANGVDSFSMANGTTNSYTHWQRNYADYGEVAFGFDVQGRSHGIVIGHDTEPNSGYTGRMNYITSRWGVPLNDARDNFRFYRKLRMESCGLPVGAQLQGEAVTQRIIDTTRFQSTSLAVASSAARPNPTLYLAYYDSLQEQIRFRWGTNNVTSRDNVTTADTGFGQFYDVDTASNRNSTGGSAYDQHIIFEPDAQYYSLIAGAENNLSNPTGNTAGEYVAIDVITGANPTADIVTVVWYDGTDLWYTYRSGDKSVDANASSTGNAYWSAPLRIFEEAGLDCAISVDANGGVHIAAYDRVEGALRYAYLSSHNVGQDDVQTCIVDDYNIVGNKISITTVLDDNDDAIPYISYYAPSAQKPKLAYLVDPSGDKAPDGVNENTEFTGAWEISTIPTGSNVSEDRINVDLWRDANNRATTSSTGTSSSDTTSGTVYGNGTNNPLAAYVINEGRLGYIETAQKK